MSAFTPNQWTLQPMDRPDHLAAAVMTSLSRPVPRQKPWVPLKTLIWGGITFGILPLVIWPKRFGEYVIAEQQQFWHLVEWLRTRTGDPQAADLKKSVRSTGAHFTVWLIPLMLLGWMVVQFLPLFEIPHFQFRDLLAVTYRYPRLFGNGATIFTRNGINPRHLYRTWVACLALGYGFHWLHIRQHAMDVRRMVGKINALLVKENIEPVRMPVLGIGIRPLWLVMAIVGVSFGAHWAVLAALAGALQARYVYVTSPQARNELGNRVRSLLLNHRPPMNVPLPVHFRLACPNSVCRAGLPDGATFCPRCGTRAVASLNQLA